MSYIEILTAPWDTESQLYRVFYIRFAVDKFYFNLQMITIVFTDRQVHSDAAWDNAVIVKAPLWANYTWCKLHIRTRSAVISELLNVISINCDKLSHYYQYMKQIQLDFLIYI